MRRVHDAAKCISFQAITRIHSKHYRPDDKKKLLELSPLSKNPLIRYTCMKQHRSFLNLFFNQIQKGNCEFSFECNKHSSLYVIFNDIIAICHKYRNGTHRYTYILYKCKVQTYKPYTHTLIFFFIVVFCSICGSI